MRTIDLTNSVAGDYTITGGAGTDTLTGGFGNDIISTVTAGEGDADTINGGSGTNTLLLSAGAHSLTNNSRLSNIQTVIANASGSSIDLTNQTESFTIDGAAGTDVLMGGKEHTLAELIMNQVWKHTLVVDLDDTITDLESIYIG